MAVGMTIRIDASLAASDLMRKIRSLPAAERRFLRRLGLETQKAAKIFAPVDRGGLQSKISIKEGRDPVKGPQVIVESEAPYSGAVEEGSRPHTPPFSPIARWARRHGIPGGAVWTSIRRHGTRPHPFMEPAKDFAEIHADRFAEEEIRRWSL